MRSIYEGLAFRVPKRGVGLTPGISHHRPVEHKERHGNQEQDGLIDGPRYGQKADHR